MRRDNSKESDFGQDSFLDVVANVVGVLVILVMLIGIRATQSVTTEARVAEVTEAESDPQPQESASGTSQEELNAEIEKATYHAGFMERGLLSTRSRIIALMRQSAMQEQHRTELAMLRAEMEQNLQQRREALSTQEQQEYDVQNQIFEAKLELEELSQEQIALISSPGVVEEIEVEPTPVARRVEDKATHIRLLGGSVCRVPFYELMDELEYELPSIRRELSTHGQVNRMVGPIDGFRLRMKTERISSNRAVTGPLVGHMSTGGERFLPTYYFLADSSELGEPIDQALLANSELRRILRTARKQSSAVVVWVYSDSFDDFRVLRKLLSELDLAAAVYNLPLGKPISASPLGREAKAQ